MVKFLKVAGWVLLAPLVWIIGNISLVCTPAAQKVEYIPLGPLPSHVLTARKVSELNEKLKATTSWFWRVDATCFFHRECMLAVPMEEGGLQLVPVGAGRAEMSAAAEEVLRVWDQENERLYPPDYEGYPRF